MYKVDYTLIALVFSRSLEVVLSVCSYGSLALYGGITLAIFSLLGTMPVRKDLLNIY